MYSSSFLPLMGTLVYKSSIQACSSSHVATPQLRVWAMFLSKGGKKKIYFTYGYTRILPNGQLIIHCTSFSCVKSVPLYPWSVLAVSMLLSRHHRISSLLTVITRSSNLQQAYSFPPGLQYTCF